MARKIQDWINDYVNSLLGERSASAIAREAQSEDEVMLMKAARRLKYHSKGEALKPRAEFLAGLEKELRRELVRARPGAKTGEGFRFGGSPGPGHWVEWPPRPPWSCSFSGPARAL